MSAVSAALPKTVLWIPAPTPALSILGMPLARRVALAGSRAGFARVMFEDSPGADLAAALAGTAAEILPAGTPPPGGESVLVLPAGSLPRPGWLRERRNGAGGEDGVFLLRGAADVPRAERWLLSGLVKDSEGFMSRHFERRVSLAISRRLASTRVTPNTMTLVSVGVGLAGAAFFLSPRASMQFAGALLFLLHSILDGCDGELARLKFQESRLGGVLDFWGDNVVHAAVFACMAAGWSLATGELRPLVLGAAAVAGTLASAAFVYRQTMAEPKEGPQFTSVVSGPSTRFSRAADALARRDFIYLVVILAAFGRAHWFLVAAAVGAPLFFLLLVGIDAASRRRLGRSYS